MASDRIEFQTGYTVWRKPKPGLEEVHCPGCGTYYYATARTKARFYWCSPACEAEVKRRRDRVTYIQKQQRRYGITLPPELRADLKARNLTYADHVWINRQTDLVFSRRYLQQGRAVVERNRARKQAEDDALFVARLNSGTLTLEQLGPMTDKKALELARALPFTPREAERLRQRLATHVAHHLDTVNEVLAGKVRWDGSQVRLFTHLLNKVMPDVSFSHHLHETVRKPLRELTREQLERIASGELDADIIDAEYTETSHASHQPPERRPRDESQS